MREIKFRAWNGKLIALPEYSDEEDFFITAHGEIRYTKEVGYERHKHSFRRKGWVLMQFTGLKDRNGKDIYEGDLILFADKYKYEVRFEDGKFVCYHVVKEYGGKWGDLKRLSDPDFSDYHHEVIGNIFANDAPSTEGTQHMLDPNVKQPEQEAGAEQEAQANSEAGEATQEAGEGQ
jgi:uncharacterized phage protein (TIGR01671 family)